MTTRSHKGIAYSEHQRDGKSLDHAVEPSSPNPKRATCLVCGRRVHFVRRTYGPNARAAHWQHTGDGLAQFRSWAIER